MSTQKKKGFIMKEGNTKKPMHPLNEVNKTSWIIDCVEMVSNHHPDTVPYRNLLKDSEKFWK